MKVTIVKSSLDFPGGSDSKASTYDVGDPGSVPGSGRSPGKGNGNPLQYSCLGNPTDRGVWWATVHGVTKSWTQLRDFTIVKSVYTRVVYIQNLQITYGKSLNLYSVCGC